MEGETVHRALKLSRRKSGPQTPVWLLSANHIRWTGFNSLKLVLWGSWWEITGHAVQMLCGYKWKFYVFVNAHHSQKILNITTFQKLNLCLTCWNQCNVMMRMMRRKSSLLREWAANGRFDAANTCWHWTLYIAKYYSTHHHSQCQHMLALAHAGVGRNTRVRANPPTTP